MHDNQFTPIEGAVLTFFGVQGTGAGLRFSTTTDCNGNYAVKVLVNSYYSAQSKANGYIVGSTIVDAYGPATLEDFQLQHLPAPSNPIPTLLDFSVNSGESFSPSYNVILTYHCDVKPTGYMASESPTFTGAEWQTSLLVNPVFALSSGVGQKNVYFKVRNAYGESATRSAQVTVQPIFNWALLTNANPTINVILSVVFTNGMFVGVGNQGTILTSTDGTNWTQRASGTTNDLNRIRILNNRLVAAGAGGTVVTSVNGINWQVQQTQTTDNLEDITFGNGLYVAVGGKQSLNTDYSENIQTSSDCITWTNITSPTNVELTTVAFGGGTFVAGGWNAGLVEVNGDNRLFFTNACLCSTNGTAWQINTNFQGPVNNLLYADQQFVAGTMVDRIKISDDGLAWRDSYSASTPSSYLLSVWDIQPWAGGWVAVGERTGIPALLISSNRVDWIFADPDFGGGLRGIAWGNGRFVATVAPGGNIAVGRAVADIPATTPAMTYQPANLALYAGQDGALVASVGGAKPLSCVWQKNGTNLADGNTVTGSHSNFLAFRAISSADGGDYTLVASNSFGTATSRVARVTILTPTLDHFSWSAMATPATAGGPFLATITAMDINGNVFTNFNGSVSLTGTNEATGRIQNASFESGTTTTPGWTQSVSGNYGQGYSSQPVNGQMPTDGSRWVELYTYNSGRYSFPMYVGNYCKITQNVDLTGLSVLRFDSALYAPAGWMDKTKGAIRIDGVPKWSQTAGGVYTNQVIDVSGYSGSHTLELRSEVVVAGTYGAQWVLFDNLRLYGQVPISPTISGNFVNGAWTGFVTVQQAATNLVLTASDDSGHAGISTPFAVINTLPPIISSCRYNPGTNGFSFSISGDNGQTIVVESCTNLTTPSWQPVQTNTLTNGIWLFSDPKKTTNSIQFYRAVLQR